MDLNTGFPKNSMKIRAKVRTKQSREETSSRRAETYMVEKPQAQRDEHEFRKLHLTLIFTVILSLAAFYLIVLNSPWMFT